MEAILQKLVAGQALLAHDWQALRTQLLHDPRRARAFHITPENLETVLGERSRLFQQLYPSYHQLCQHSLNIPADPVIFWDLWLPLALNLRQQRQAIGRPWIQGILGGQGTGKTTMGAILTLILTQLGYPTLSLSLDDFYLTYAERQALRLQDPRLIWRGPPGTHDLELGKTVFRQLRQGDRGVQVPRFDKSAYQGMGDRATFEQVDAAEIVLFEGWFVGVRPIDPATFDQAPPPIATPADRSFARDMNQRLQDYLPWWDYLDSLMVLRPEDYRFSQQWRRQAEQQRIASGQAGMSDAEIDQFVEYFWKAIHPELFGPPLLNHATWVDWVIEIRADHTPGAIYSVREE